jgi:molybdopterin-guanine dinucleotide biosynthesis protein A
MGQDKALMRLASKTLLECTHDLLQECLKSIYVSIKEDQIGDPIRAKFKLIIDKYNQSGPMAGILSAHKSHPNSAWLVVACDMPWLDKQTLLQLMEERDTAFDATAFNSPEDDLPEPLCAIYEPNLLSEILSNSNLLPTNSPRDLLMQSKVKVINAKNPNALKNTNYPGDDLSEIES